MLSQLAAWFKMVFEQLASFVIEVIFSVFGWIWSAFVFLLDSFGISEQINSASVAFDSIPDSVWYFLNMFEAQFGLGLILSAYGIRFLIRRIPVVG